MSENADTSALVLIVDDSPTHIAVVRQSLEAAGFRIAVATTGREGLERAIELRPDLVLMDIVMPDMNGFQATRELSRNPATQHIPVILASSKSGDSDRVWGLRQGAVEYLTKPFDPSELLASARQAIARAAAIGPQLNHAKD
jgi:twitching motility two-component system response regulator PilH